MSGFELEQYKEQFKAIVLNHLENVLPAEEWENLRGFCQGPSIVDEPARPGATRQEILAASLCESGLSPADILKGRYKALAVQIGETSRKAKAKTKKENMKTKETKKKKKRIKKQQGKKTKENTKNKRERKGHRQNRKEQK